MTKKMKIEALALMIFLAMFATLGPLAISATSTALNLIGLVFGFGLGWWLISFVKRVNPYL